MEPAVGNGASSAMETENSTPVSPDISSEQILLSYSQTLVQIKLLLSQLTEIKRTPSASLDEKKSKCAPLLQKVIILLSELRLHNREIYLGVEARKANSVRLRTKLDAHSTLLQQRQFELQFLIREIHNTREYRPREKEFAMITDEEFEKTAPAELKVSKADNLHQYELNRLNFELQQRKSLVARLTELKMRKKALIEANSNKLKYLDGLVSKLKSLTKAAQPIQTYLGIQATKTRTMHQFSALLPPALYNLVQLATAYKEAFADADLDIDLKTAIDLESLKPGAPLPVVLLDQPKKLTDIDPKKASVDLYRAHPIGVQMDIRCSAAASAPSATLLFQYLVHLALVTVTVQGAGADHSLLVSLFPGDSGIDVPSNAVHFKFADGSDFHFSQSQLGRPYAWAQSLCGLLFFQEKNQQSAQLITPAQLRINFKNTVRAIKGRMRVRQALASQLDMLARLLIPASPTSSSATVAPKDSPTFANWKKILQLEFDAVEYPPAALKVSASGPSSLSATGFFGAQYYRATFNRADESVDVFIELAPSYPDRPPLLKYRYSSKQFPVTPSSSAAASSAKPSSSSSAAAAAAAGTAGAVKGDEKGTLAVKTEGMAAEMPPALEIAYRKLMVIVSEAESVNSASSAVSSSESDSNDFLLSTLLRKFRSLWLSKLSE